MARSLESRIERLEQRQQQGARAPAIAGSVIVRAGATAQDTAQRIEDARREAGFKPDAHVIARVLVAPKGV